MKRNHRNKRAVSRSSDGSDDSKASMGSVLSHISSWSDRFRRPSSTTSSGALEMSGTGAKARRSGFSPVHFKKEKIIKQIQISIEKQETEQLDDVLQGIDLSELEDSETANLTVKACETEDLCLLAVLLRHGSCINGVGEHGKTPLHISSKRGNSAMTALLLSHSASPNIQSKYEGKTALHYAVAQDCEEVVLILLNHGAIVNQRDIYGSTPLHVACRGGNKPMAKLLLDNRADIDMYDNDGWTSLHLASAAGRVDIVKLLLERRANIDCQTMYGRTALHWACTQGQLSAVHELLQRGASANIRDLHDKLPLAYSSADNIKNLVSIYTEKNTSKHFVSTIGLFIEIDPRRRFREASGNGVTHAATIDGVYRSQSGSDIDCESSITSESCDLVDALQPHGVVRMRERNRGNMQMSSRLSHMAIPSYENLVNMGEMEQVQQKQGSLHENVQQLIKTVGKNAGMAEDIMKKVIRTFTVLSDSGLDISAHTVALQIGQLQESMDRLTELTKYTKQKEAEILPQLDELEGMKSDADIQSVSHRYVTMVVVFAQIIEEYVTRQENGWRTLAYNLRIPRSICDLLGLRMQMEGLRDEEKCRQIIIQWSRLVVHEKGGKFNFVSTVMRAVKKCDFQDLKADRSRIILSLLVHKFTVFKTETEVDDRQEMVSILLNSLDSKERGTLHEALCSDRMTSDETDSSETSDKKGKSEVTGTNADDDVDNSLRKALKDILDERDEEKLAIIARCLIAIEREELLADIL